MIPKKSPFLTCKDYNVSRETFKLLLQEDTEMLVTSPQPKVSDLGKYYESENYISHTDANKSLFEKAYQLAKNYATKKKIRLLKKQNNTVKNKITVLDVGCGTGEFLVACKNENWHVVGVEPNSKAQELAVKKLNTTEEKTPLYNSIENIKKEHQFDIITLWHVLEHVPDLKNNIKQLQQLLKPNGTLIIAVPNYKSFDAKHYKQFWAAYDVPRHLWHFSQKSIAVLFKEQNMTVQKTVPMKMDAFYVSLLSEKNKTGKSNPIKAFFIGLKSNFKARSSSEYSSLIYIIKNN